MIQRLNRTCTQLPGPRFAIAMALSLCLSACDGGNGEAANGNSGSGDGEARLEWLGGPSMARGVSGDGTAVVGDLMNPLKFEPFHWQGDEVVGLGALAENSQTVGYAASADGNVVVGTNRGPRHEFRQAFRWQNGTMTGLGHLPGGDRSEAYDISADGSVVVGMSNRDRQDPNGCATQAVRWVNGNISGLGSLGDKCRSPSEALGISPDGKVIVGKSSSANGIEPFRWKAGNMIGLGVVDRDAGGKGVSKAKAVSGDGSVVVGEGYYYAENGRPLTVAFRWKDGRLTSLGFLPGHSRSFASSVSTDGTIVVGQSTTSEANEQRAFIWTEDEGLQDLKTVLEDEYGLNLGESRLAIATDISHNGKVIVGTGVPSMMSPPQAWRVTLQ